MGTKRPIADCDDCSTAWRETTGPNPTDRGTAGTTRRLLSDDNVTPPGEPAPQRLCLDNGGDNDAMRQRVVA